MDVAKRILRHLGARCIDDSSDGPGVPLGTLYYSGWYTQILYFLTGETRPYNRKIANLDRVKPIRNAKWGDDPDCDSQATVAGLADRRKI